jgi:glycosyltransferase involved in cell wall biosynthesis
VPQILSINLKMPQLSLVVPCRNESARLPATLDAIQDFLNNEELDAEVLIVVENSADETAEIALKQAAGDARFRAVCNEVARGKGYAVKTGMLAAEGEVVFFMDADLSVPLRFVRDFLPFFDRRAEVVFGSRQHPESIVAISQPFLRVFYGRAFNLCLRMLGATSFKDTQCGFKAFRREAARRIFSRLTLDGFGFDVEAMALAEAMGMRIVERPVEWSDAPGSKVRALRDGSSAFFEAVLAAWRVRRENRPSLP